MGVAYLIRNRNLSFQDYRTIPAGRGISEAQRRRLDSLRDALAAHIKSGADTKYSTCCIVRAWLTFMKNSDDNIKILKKMEAEVASLGPNPYSVFSKSNP